MTRLDQARPILFDVATACHIGKRAQQEDAIYCDFVQGKQLGFVVLADGMGGHAAGEVASNTVTEHFMSALSKLNRQIKMPKDISKTLSKIAQSANDCLARKISNTPETSGMGTTLLAVTFHDDQMRWLSVGDSPLFLLRNGALHQLNEDHSLAPQIDLLVASGLMDPEEGRNHPDRNVLTSVLMGGDVAKTDCPNAPFALWAGDIIVAASDGLQTLDHCQLEFLLLRNRAEPSAVIVSRLLQAINAIDSPDQDNTTFSVIRVNQTGHAVPKFNTPRLNVKEATPKVISFLRNHFPSMVRIRGAENR